MPAAGVTLPPFAISFYDRVQVGNTGAHIVFQLQLLSRSISLAMA